MPIDLLTRVDDIHRAILEMLPPDLLDLSDIPATREKLAGFFEAMPAPELPDDVTIEDVHVPGLDGDPDVLVRLYKPASAETGGPGLFWIHGGGMVLMSVDTDDAKCARWASELNITIASVDYRLAPETPFPGPMNDCYAGLQWFAANAGDLGIDAGRIAIGGASAGGGLAAGLALMARDRGGPDICFQLLVYPMIDHRNETPSSHAITDGRVWNREANIAAWAAYLGGADEVSTYASPSVCDDLEGLPPAFVNVGDLDMFLDEDVDYAQRLLQAGVPTEVHVYPGAFHGSNGFAADAPLSQRWIRDEDDALRRALHGG